MGERGSSARRRPGMLCTLIAVGLAWLIIAPGVIPADSVFALPLDAVLPWLGVPVAMVLVAALARRRSLGTLAALAAVVVWAVAFLPGIMPAGAVAGAGTVASAADAAPLSVLSQNLHGAAGDPEGTARAALQRDPDLIAFQEVDGESIAALAAVLDEAYPYTAAVGTVGMWSKYPLEGFEPLDLGLGWNRALRVTLAHPSGPVAVYAVHAASARVFSHESRDEMLSELAALVASDPAPRLVALGDFNAGSEDRELAPLLAQLSEPRQESGGFGFSWPSATPFVRLDHVLVRGMQASGVETVRIGASDHLAVTATLRPASP